MLQRFLKWFGAKLLAFIHIQLFVSLVSLPILISWGLPISTLAPLGNFFFGPFLTLFLSVSCIIFFTELAHIPNEPFIWALEQITSLWHYLLGFGSKTWLLSFKTPSPWFFVLLLLATACVVYHKKLQSLQKSSLCFAALLGIAYLYLAFLNVPHYALAKMPCNNAQVTILKTPKTLSIIDPGIIGRRISAPSWVEYTLLPALRSQYGMDVIENVILLAPGIVTFDVITEMMRIIPIKNIYLPLWHGESPPRLIEAYNKLKETASMHGVTLHRVGKKAYTLSLDKVSTLSLRPLDEQCAYRTVKFPAIEVIGNVQDETVMLYTHKFKHDCSKT